MEEGAEKFLFPFEYVTKGSRVLIYGAGFVGQRYLRQVMALEYCCVIGFADRNYDSYSNLMVPVYAPDQIHVLKFDFVVVALRNSIPLHAVREILLREGVSEEKIIFVGERSYPDIWLDKDASVDAGLAFSVQENSFAFSLSGGFGDMIIQKRFLAEIIRLAPDCKIDIYCVNDVPFMEWLYSDCKEQVQNILLNKGTYYEKYKAEYALGITLDGAGYWAVDVFHPDRLSEMENILGEKIRELIDFWKSEDMLPIPSYNTIYNRWIYKGLNCYTRFCFSGIFDIHDEVVNIPMIDDFEKDFQTYKLQSYITVNFGVGNSIDGKGVAKSWPKERFEEVIRRIHKRYPTVKVVQAGGCNAMRLKGADFYCLGKSFGLVGCLLKHALLHIDIEGGLMHLATQLGTKCAVLYGPTQVAYVGYPQNINIQAGICHDCYGLYDNLDRCARGMEEPECMYKITPKYVMTKIIPYLDEVVAEHSF